MPNPASFAFALSFALSVAAGQVCAASLAQSPIDIVTRDAVRASLPSLVFDYAPLTDLSIINTGSPDEEATIRADVAPGSGRILLGGVAFDLLQFHFHAEAEHTIDGVRAAMELHQVHRSADGALAVVGRLVEPGDENAALAPYFDNLPADPGGVIGVDDFALSALVPASLASWRYDGSLTTPPFTEGVSWVVLAEPLHLSVEQIDAFKALFPEENLREVQPLNGRVVLTDVAPVPLPGAFWLMLAGLAALGARGRRA